MIKITAVINKQVNNENVKHEIMGVFEDKSSALDFCKMITVLYNNVFITWEEDSLATL